MLYVVSPIFPIVGFGLLGFFVLVASGLSGEIYPPMQHPSSLLTGAMPVHRVMFFGLAGRSRGWGKKFMHNYQHL